jgi:hypothetical protein
MKEANYLSTMPTLTIWHILNFLDPKSLLKIYQTNKNLLTILSDPASWKQYYLQKFTQIQLLPFDDFISSIQNDTLGKAERNIIVTIINSEKAVWPNLENFFNYLKDKKENQLPKNYFDGFKKRVIVTLNKYLVCKNQQGSPKDYKSLTILSLEQQLGEYLSFISCLYLLHSNNFIGAIELIMGKNLDKMLTSNDLVLLDAYTGDLIGHLFSDISNPRSLNLLNKLTVPDWSTLINDHPSNASTCSSLAKAISKGFLTPDLDEYTINTLVRFASPSDRIFLFNHTKYSPLIDKEYMQYIIDSTSNYRKKENEKRAKANCLKAKTTELNFCSGKEKTERDQSKIINDLTSRIAEKDKAIGEQQGQILDLKKALAAMKKEHLVLENKVTELTKMVEMVTQFLQSQQVNNKNEQNISVQNKEEATPWANKGTLGNSILSSLSTLFGKSAKENNQKNSVNESQKASEVNKMKK